MTLVEIVSIGNELLAGSTLNTNAAFLSKKLSELGFQVGRHTTIGDDEEVIIEALSESLAIAPLVIVTGGLGPTLDDITKDAAASLFDSSLELDETILEELKGRYGDHPSLVNQATVPKKALVLKNALGTAPGLVLHNGKSTLILLPGVPYEMRALMEAEVIPFLAENFKAEVSGETAKIFCGEMSESHIDPILRDLKSRFPSLEMGIYPNIGLVTVTLKGSVRDVELAKRELKDHLTGHLYESSDGKIETAIYEVFSKNKWTLSVAESCTGGALSARLVSIPSASTYFLGGVVAYANALKENLLHVDPKVIERRGAVSPEVAIAMAEGLEKLTGSDFSLAITGIAGPLGGSLEKPLGTVFIAIKAKNKAAEVIHLKAHGSREMVISRSVNAALFRLYNKVTGSNR